MKHALVAVALLLPATALAGATGAGIPETGGPGAGAASADARGLYYNPAAAVGANGTELDADMAVNVLDVHYQRNGIDSNGTPSDTSDDHPFRAANALNLAPVPYFAIRADSFGRRENRGRYHNSSHSAFGLGFTLAVPFGRRVTYAGTSPGRYHIVRLDYFTAYAIPSFAVRVSPSWRIGAGPMICFSQYTLTQAVDLAPTLQAVMPSNPPPPAESGVLQGEIAVKEARAIEPGFSFGTLVDVGDTATIGLGFLSGSISNATGKAKVTPSQDFAVHANSDFKLRRYLPPIVNLGARVRPPETPVEVSFELQYVGWHVVKHDEITLSNSQLQGDNADINNLLTVLGVNQGTLVSGLLDQKQTVARHWHDSVNAILGAEYKYSGFRSRFEIGYDRSAIDDKDVNPGSLDFDTLVLGAALRYEPKEKPFTAQISIGQYLNQSRTVTNSSFSSSADPASGYAFPSGNGTYSAVLTRVALSTSYRF